ILPISYFSNSCTICLFAFQNASKRCPAGGEGAGVRGAKYPNRHTTQHRMAPHEAAKKKQTLTGN
ncbi:MAG: hypothetical protein ACK56U_11690, partial [Planctomyces sp.]